MAGLWNPNAPGTLGLEWMPVHSAASRTFSGPYRAQVLRSTAAQTVTALRFGIEPTTNQANPVVNVCEIYDLADLAVQPATQTVDYAPSADGAIGTWENSAGTGVNLWDYINDPVVYPPQGTLSIRMFSPTSSAYHCYVASGAFPLTARVQRLSITAVIGRVVVTGTAARQFAFRLYYVPTGTMYSPSANRWAPHFGELVEINCGEINPVTGLPWSPLDVREFAPGGDWQVRVESVATAGCGSQIPSMALRVHYTDPDPRLAVGTYRRPAGMPGPIVTTDALVQLSAGGWVANWAKPNAADHAFLFRRANAVAVTATANLAQDIQWTYSRDEAGPGGAGRVPPVPGMVSRVVAADTLGRITSVTASQEEFAARLDLIVAGAVADDSQPYRVAYNTASHTGASRVAIAPSGTYAAQRFTPASNQSYLGVRFITAPPRGTGTNGTETLEVTIRRVSDNVQMGGSLTVTAAQVRAGQSMPNNPTFYVVEGFLSAGAALVSGTQYELRFEPLAGPASLPWVFIGAVQDGSPSSNTAGFQGATNGIIVNGVADANRDIGAVIQLQPAQPVEQVAEVIPVEQSGRGSDCAVGFIDEVVITWRATSLAGSFARYEIERLDDDAGVWQQVAVALTESLNPFQGTTLNRWVDRQVPRNRSAKYRIRVVSTSGAVSEWSETDFVSPRSYGCEVIFTSNADPSIQLVYCREPRVGMVDMNNQSDELVRIYGAYGHVSYAEPEDRGVAQTMTIIASFGSQPTDSLGRPIGATAVFDPLRNTIRGAAGRIPYVCVLDWEGNRYFARVQFGAMTRDEPGWRYKAELQIVPLTLENGTVAI